MAPGVAGGGQRAGEQGCLSKHAPQSALQGQSGSSPKGSEGFPLLFLGSKCQSLAVPLLLKERARAPLRMSPGGGVRPMPGQFHTDPHPAPAPQAAAPGTHDGL